MLSYGMEVKELPKNDVNKLTGSTTYRITAIIGTIIIDAIKTVGDGYILINTDIYIHDERRIIRTVLTHEELKELRDCLNEILKDQA
jgi:hypothetical protein